MQIDTEEFKVDSLSVSVAQRYSVLVTAKNSTDLNYYFHANLCVHIATAASHAEQLYSNPDMFDTVPETLSLNYTTNIVYDDNADYFDATTLDAYTNFDDTQLVPVEVVPMYV